MNEQQALSSGTPDSAGTYELTPGAYLRESREAAGLHLATLAASLFARLFAPMCAPVCVALDSAMKV